MSSNIQQTNITIQNAVDTSITQQTFAGFVMDTAVSAGIGAAAVALVANPVGILGGAIFGGTVHLAQKGVDWAGHQLFKCYHTPANYAELEVLWNDKANSWDKKAGFLAQTIAAVVAIALTSFAAIKYAACLGITETTLLTLSSLITLPTAIALTATAIVGKYVLKELFNYINTKVQEDVEAKAKQEEAEEAKKKKLIEESNAKAKEESEKKKIV